MSEGRTEAGRREVGDRSEEFHLNGYSNGMQNPEFKLFLSEEIIMGSVKFPCCFCPAKVQNIIQFVMKRLGEI
jgi:hypothetical protein